MGFRDELAARLRDWVAGDGQPLRFVMVLMAIEFVLFPVLQLF
jgi:hypothetical protein